MTEVRITNPRLLCLPEPTRNRHGRPLPPATIELLLLVQGLLVYARDLLDTLRQAAKLGFSLMAQCFGAAPAGFVLTHLTRGILRAIALERVLLAATGGRSDFAAGKSGKRIASARQHSAPHPAHACHDQFARLPTLPQLEAIIRRQPVEAAVDDICHDLGVCFSLCEARFGNALRDMIAAYRDTLSNYLKEFRQRVSVAAGAPKRNSAFGLPPQKPDAIRYIEGCLGARQPVCGFPFTASPVGAARDGAEPLPEPA